MLNAVQIRPLSVDDAPAMAEVLRAASLYEFIGGSPPSAAELARRYAVQVAGVSPDGQERWINEVVVLEPHDRPIGYVQATIPIAGGPTEIAWVIGEPWQGHGYAARAAQLLVELLAGRGVTELVAHIHPDNVASQKIAQRLGLQPTNLIVEGETRWEGPCG
ncbi:GNAT family N-acetyltransferase [uncultured Tessaracoccus sp.]|uniref:GNAT family N-acetyltransferase n=1 Tax=uncultured Tessaracoccus sp. TaxID=905023 RepID=UPI00262FF8F9|nr:GNAT family N-acetyltransferase [uncultured Tessaracoccus sp.]